MIPIAILSIYVAFLSADVGDCCTNKDFERGSVLLSANETNERAQAYFETRYCMHQVTHIQSYAACYEHCNTAVASCSGFVLVEGECFICDEDAGDITELIPQEWWDYFFLWRSHLFEMPECILHYISNGWYPDRRVGDSIFEGQSVQYSCFCNYYHNNLMYELRCNSDGFRVDMSTLCIEHPTIFRLVSVEGEYNLSFIEAQQYCESNFAYVATYDQLLAAANEGMDCCSCGWLADGSAAYPVLNPRTWCNEGGSPGVTSNECVWHEEHNVYCSRVPSEESLAVAENYEHFGHYEVYEGGYESLALPDERV